MKRFISLALVFVLLASSFAFAADAEPVKAEGAKTFQEVYLDGGKVDLGAYLINQRNYVKLRDVAALLTATDAKFNVGYEDHKVVITTGEGYEKLDTDLVELPEGKVEAEMGEQAFVFNGEEKMVKTALINQNNYLQLRELGELIGFGVHYNKETKAIELSSKVEEKAEEAKDEMKDEKAEEKKEEKFSEEDESIFKNIITLNEYKIQKYKSHFMLPLPEDENERFFTSMVNLSKLYGRRLYTENPDMEKSIIEEDGMKKYVVNFKYDTGAENTIKGYYEGDSFQIQESLSVGAIIPFIDMDKDIGKLSSEELLKGFTEFHDAVVSEDYKKAVEVLRSLNYDADEAKVKEIVEIRKADAKKIGKEIFKKPYSTQVDVLEFGDSNYFFIYFKYGNSVALRFDVCTPQIKGLGSVVVLTKSASK